MKKLYGMLLTLAVLLVPTTAFAQEVDPNDLGELINVAITAAKGGDWSLLISVVLMFLVYLATKVSFIKNWLPKAARPWVVAISGVVLAIAVTASTTGDWLSAAFNGLVTGAAATGLWELVGKKFLGGGAKDEPSDEEDVPVEE